MYLMWRHNALNDLESVVHLWLDMGNKFIRLTRETNLLSRSNQTCTEIYLKLYSRHTPWRLHPWLNLDNCYCLPCYSFLLQSLYISHRPLKSPKYFAIHANLACVDVILKDSDGVSVIAISNRNHLKSMTGCRMIMGNQ